MPAKTTYEERYRGRVVQNLKRKAQELGFELRGRYEITITYIFYHFVTAPYAGHDITLLQSPLHCYFLTTAY